jgi:oligopeptidase B
VGTSERGQVNWAAMNAPHPPQRPYVHTEHGIDRPDPYYWLRDKQNPEVIDYIDAENAYMAASTEGIKDLTQTVYQEMRDHLQEADTSAPVPRGEFVYYRRTLEGKSYAQYCRRADGGRGDEQVLLDVNALAEGHEFTSVGAIDFSPDQTRMAYCVDHTGAERYVIVVVDLEDGSVIESAIDDVEGDVTWAADSQTLLYCTFDETQRPDRVWAHRVGTSREDDRALFHEVDPKFRAWVGRTRSNAWLVIGVGSGKTTEMHVVPADNLSVPPRCLQPRHLGMQYWVCHSGAHFYLRTNDSDDADGSHNDDAVNCKLMRAPTDATSRDTWDEVVAHRAGVELKGVTAFADHLVLLEREGGLPHLRVLDLKTGQSHRVEQQEACYDLGIYANHDFDASRFLYGYDSMVTPFSVFSYDVDARESTLVKQTVVPGYDPSLYTTERIQAVAEDGTEVPVSLVYKRDLPRDRPNPTLLYGYGSYAITIDASFSAMRLPLLDRGVVFAVAHIRGGGLMGRPWYEAGKFLHKRRTFTDFIAVGRHLVKDGWTTPESMAIMGGSAGGMLMGAVVNMAPELWHCCVAAVPFVDVVTTMFDASLPLTTNEWEEWGDPRDKAYYDCMMSYSPYDNIDPGTDFPHLLITSGLNDPRVQYWEPTKWCARLRERQTNGAQLLLKTHMGAGHQGASGRFGRFEDRAFEYAWILNKLGA